MGELKAMEIAIGILGYRSEVGRLAYLVHQCQECWKYPIIHRATTHNEISSPQCNGAQIEDLFCKLSVMAWACHPIYLGS